LKVQTFQTSFCEKLEFIITFRSELMNKITLYIALFHRRIFRFFLPFSSSWTSQSQFTAFFTLFWHTLFIAAVLEYFWDINYLLLPRYLIFLITIILFLSISYSCKKHKTKLNDTNLSIRAFNVYWIISAVVNIIFVLS
jgi:hypothetical protein